MKKLRNLAAVACVIGVSFVMTGCGGDDDDDDNNNPPANQFAPASIENTTVVLQDNAAGSAAETVAFATTTFTSAQSGATNVTGNFQYTRTGDNTATVVLTDPATGLSRTVLASFSSATAGTYTFTTSAGGSGSGTFSGLATNPGGNNGGGDNGGNNGGNNGGGDNGGNNGGNNGGETNTPPANLSGRTVNFNTTSGPLVGATTVTFGTGNTFTSSNTGSGNYTYTLSGNSATLVLDYTAPTDFVGDRDSFVITFNAGSGTAGTFTGTTRIDDAESPMAGSFQFQ